MREQRALGLRKAGPGVVLDSDRPHLVAIDDDPLTTGVTLYHLKVLLLHLSYSMQSFVVSLTNF